MVKVAIKIIRLKTNAKFIVDSFLGKTEKVVHKGPLYQEDLSFGDIQTDHVLFLYRDFLNVVASHLSK